MHNISQSLIDRYSAGPSTSKTTQVANLQTTIREVLGDDYDTFLQGSYRNGTAIADINDVDIVARRKATNAPLSAATWESLFNTIASWSRLQKRQRPNYPRTHYDNGVNKHSATSEAFKPTVRLFKRWARQYSSLAETAPSFYIECAVHAVSNGKFSTYLPLSFSEVGREICGLARSMVVYSVAGDKAELVKDEWHPDKFEAFQTTLVPDLRYVVRAMNASTMEEANRLWKLAFGET